MNEKEIEIKEALKIYRDGIIPKTCGIKHAGKMMDARHTLCDCATVCLEVLAKEKKPLIDKAYSVNCGSDNYKIGYNQCLNEIQQLIKKER